MRKLFIIHNLTTFVEIKQVEDYIENTLMKNYSFELEKIQIPKYGDKNKNENQYYWREKNLNKNNFFDIRHLIMANDDGNSEAGKYYNNSTIDYIKKQIMSYVDYTKFDIKKLLKNFLFETSKEIFEKQLKLEDIIEEDNKIIAKNKEFKLKKCLIDELGINTFVDVSYKPKHRRYKLTENGENLYVIEVEIPGGVEDFIQTLDNKVGNNIITIKGKKKSIKIIKKNVNKEEDKNNIISNEKIKKYDEDVIKKEKKEEKKETKDIKNEKNIENEIITEWKPFELEIKIPLDVVQLDKFLKCEKENGIYKFYYSIITIDSDSDTLRYDDAYDDDDDDNGSDKEKKINMKQKQKKLNQKNYNDDESDSEDIY